jgi:hypothetical protein
LNHTLRSGATIQRARSFEDVLETMRLGERNRSVAATNMNTVSSRSHAILTITLTQTKVNDDTGITSTMVSKLNLVDLAGSESGRTAGVQGDRLKEVREIFSSTTPKADLFQRALRSINPC